jgi:hypothetical protein
MKHGALSHPMIFRLSRRLGVRTYAAVGIIELLYHRMFNALGIYQGDLTPIEIAAAVEWSASDELCSALTACDLVKKAKGKLSATKFLIQITRPPLSLREHKLKRRAILMMAPVNDFSDAQWLEILRNFEGKCAYCHERKQPLAREHMIPLSRGGDNTATNIVPSCVSCNSRKGTKTPLEFFASLLSRNGV